MTVRAKPINVDTFIGTMDTEARAAMVRAQHAIAPLVTAYTPKRTGVTAAALKPRVRKVATGASLTVGATRGARHGETTVANVVNWLTKGTGTRRVGGGPKRPIKSSRLLGRMTLPGGKKVRSVAGQHPNPFLARIRAAGSPIVEREGREGAKIAAQKAARTLL